MNKLSAVGTKIFAGCAMLLASLAGQQLAQAKNPSFEVDQITPMGRFGGRPYVEVEGVMVGTIDRPDGTTGSYRAPFRAAIPQRRGNGVAVLTPVNSAAFNNYPPERLSETDLGDTTLWMIGDYLYRNGYTYMAFGWNKRVTDFFGDNPPRRQDRARAYGRSRADPTGPRSSRTRRASSATSSRGSGMPYRPSLASATRRRECCCRNSFALDTTEPTANSSTTAFCPAAKAGFARR